jgi:hypothetical protein
LTVRGYAESGGVRSALTQTTETVFRKRRRQSTAGVRKVVGCWSESGPVALNPSVSPWSRTCD